jgi:integrase
MIPMARRLRSAQLENRTARLKLPIQWKPQAWTAIAPGIRLGIRRCKGPSRWVIEAADGKGGRWQKVLALADDYEESDGEHVLTFWQASERARKLVRGSEAEAGAPITVGAAINLYENDLVARGQHASNAARIRRHVSASLAAKPVALLSAAELARWRDALLAGKLERSSVRRTCRSLAAALSLASKRDARIKNADAWRHGLGGITGASGGTRNAQTLSNPQVHALIAAAFAESDQFGLYIQVAAETGARLSQIAKLNCADLQNGGEPRLMMPSSRKGRGRRAITHKPVPITPALAQRLAASAAERAADAPLLLRVDGLRWQTNDFGDHLVRFRKAAIAAGAIVDGKPVSAYSLRHSSIVRMLLANVPARLVASAHDTSLAELEKTYSAFISDHGDALLRLGLLETPPAAARKAKVVPLRSRP